MTAVDDWAAALDRERHLTPAIVSQLLATHGDRGRRAIEAVGEQRVKQYNDFTVVVGRRQEYIVEGTSCLCPDARYNLDQTDPTQLCWHVIAVLIATRIDATDDYDLWYADIDDI